MAIAKVNSNAPWVQETCRKHASKVSSAASVNYSKAGLSVGSTMLTRLTSNTIECVNRNRYSARSLNCKLETPNLRCRVTLNVRTSWRIYQARDVRNYRMNIRKEASLLNGIFKVHVDSSFFFGCKICRRCENISSLLAPSRAQADPIRRKQILHFDHFGRPKSCIDNNATKIRDVCTTPMQNVGPKQPTYASLGARQLMRGHGPSQRWQFSGVHKDVIAAGDKRDGASAREYRIQCHEHCVPILRKWLLNEPRSNSLVNLDGGLVHPSGRERTPSHSV